MEDTIRTAIITDILNEKQIKDVMDYINNEAKSGRKATDTQVIKGLKEILSKWKDELILKGIDSDYLAYAIAFEMEKSNNFHFII